jgi:hypothetical protein
VAKAELDLFRAVLDRRADHGLAANLQRLSWCATQAREHLSLDHWHALKRLSAEIEACRDRASDVSALLEFLDEALTTFVSLSGFAMDTMTRDMGWRLHIIGRRLERLDNLAGTLARFLRRYTGLDPAQPRAGHRSPARAVRLGHHLPHPLPRPARAAAGDPPPHHGRGQPPRAGLPAAHGRQLPQPLREERLALGLAELEQAFAGLQVFPWKRSRRTPEADRHAACVLLATRLEALADAGRQLSDRLAMRFFSHVGGNRQATFAA